MKHIPQKLSVSESAERINLKVATEVFEHLVNADHEIRLTCPFLRRLGATRAEWCEKFQLRTEK